MPNQFIFDFSTSFAIRIFSFFSTMNTSTTRWFYYWNDKCHWLFVHCDWFDERPKEMNGANKKFKWTTIDCASITHTHAQAQAHTFESVRSFNHPNLWSLFDFALFLHLFFFLSDLGKTYTQTFTFLCCMVSPIRIYMVSQAWVCVCVKMVRCYQFYCFLILPYFGRPC